MSSADLTVKGCPPAVMIIVPSLHHVPLSGTQLIDALKADRRLGTALQSPSVSYGSTNLYMRGPLEEATRSNLSRPLSELVDGGGSVVQARCCRVYPLRVTSCFQLRKRVVGLLPEGMEQD